MKTRALVAILLLTAAHPAAGQIISPGKLATAHAQYEGVRSCTQCHELKQRGISNLRCLACHTQLRDRINLGRGYHATVRTQTCSNCHKEHLGRDFELIRMDTTSFRHDRIGFPLRGAHQQAGCHDCHKPALIAAADVKNAKTDPAVLKRTYLGLPTECAACHRADDPHGAQFARRKCSDCHDETDWKPANRFDHASTRYSLTGRHSAVECSGCHKAARNGEVRWAGLDHAACTSCHRDPHSGAARGTCTSCHSTAGWERVDTAAVRGAFDHSRTRFNLRGAHARLTCPACHRPRRDARIRLTFASGEAGAPYPTPHVTDCGSCHVDPHPAALTNVAGRASCAACHTERAWSPASYDVARHNRAGGFPLTGAHAVTPCTACHAQPNMNGQTFVLPRTACVACHAEQDPHKGTFGQQACSDCHNTTSFRGARFDHERAANRACRECHASADPHERQFGERGCEQCHDTRSFRISAFDHTRTKYPLDGAHVKLACAGCHRSENAANGKPFTRYTPLRSECSACHGRQS